jgi:hypothetical protein
MLRAKKIKENGSLSYPAKMHCQTKESTVLCNALQRHNTENSKQLFPGKELQGLSPIQDKVRKLCWTGQKGEGRAVGEDLEVHKIENFFYSNFGICVISLFVMSKYKDLNKKIF